MKAWFRLFLFSAVCVILVGCSTTSSQSTIYGVPATQWHALSKSQQQMIIKRYKQQKTGRVAKEKPGVSIYKEKNWHEATNKKEHLYSYEPFYVSHKNQ